MSFRIFHAGVACRAVSRISLNNRLPTSTFLLFSHSPIALFQIICYNKCDYRYLKVKEYVIMSKGKKKPSNRSKNKAPNTDRNQVPNSSRSQTPNNGRNRQEKREAARNPQAVRKSNKPIWLRIIIIAALIVMVLGFVVAPLIH